MKKNDISSLVITQNVCHSVRIFFTQYVQLICHSARTLFTMLVKIPSFLIPCFLLGIYPLAAQTPPNFPKLFQQQLEVSCLQPFIYEKKLHDLKNSANTEEKQTFEINIIKNPSQKNLLKDELAYSFEFDASDIKRKGDFTQSTKNDTLIYHKVPTSNTELSTQKILYQNQKIRFVESVIVKKYWLYTMEMHIKVYFDAKGEYNHHFLRMYSKITGMEALDSYILGRRS